MIDESTAETGRCHLGEAQQGILHKPAHEMVHGLLLVLFAQIGPVQTFESEKLSRVVLEHQLWQFGGCNAQMHRVQIVVNTIADQHQEVADTTLLVEELQVAQIRDTVGAVGSESPTGITCVKVVAISRRNVHKLLGACRVAIGLAVAHASTHKRKLVGHLTLDRFQLKQYPTEYGRSAHIPPGLFTSLDDTLVSVCQRLQQQRTGITGGLQQMLILLHVCHKTCGSLFCGQARFLTPTTSVRNTNNRTVLIDNHVVLITDRIAVANTGLLVDRVGAHRTC
mmetsp:Transcript_33577/g.84291  ORF Transcript_33577/g.84291 Transcript_33577/m.84291 type:complete len:281 (+) Transcript_33577:379-1221(+)